MARGEEKVDHPELVTVGREFYSGYRLFLRHRSREDFSSTYNQCERFRIILVEQGSGILTFGTRQLVFGAPVLFCLNEQEKPELVQSQNLNAQSIYFHPNAINGSFTFDNVHNDAIDSEWHDYIWLRPFIQRDKQWLGYLNLGPITAARISRLFVNCGQELSLQRDTYWPCRSRSFFLEILFLLDRLITAPDSTDNIEISETAALSEIGPVILYLHNNYGEKLTLDSLARQFHTNRTTLSKRFRQMTGLTVMAYLTRLRINLASLLLRDTELSINEIVERIGYNNSTHFGRTFRSQTGYSPSEYRRKYCWMLQ